MAHRDKSQGFGFMYVNMAKILQERDTAPASEAKEMAPVLTNNVKTVNFNKDTDVKESVKRVAKPSAAASPSATSNPSAFMEERTKAIEQIKQNLDRLQSLHHRLHTILDELNQITRDKK